MVMERTELRPAPGFVDTPHPPIAGPERLVGRTEEIDIARPLAKVLAAVEAMPLADAIDPDAGLPGVVGTYGLTPEAFGPPGTRHLVFLTDGTTVREQVLERTTTATDYRFRYVVWGYTTPAAKPLKYGLGDFHYTAAGPDRTHIRWTYAFELRPDRFPGFLGVGLGGWLLKKAFLDTTYARWLRASLARTKAAAEAWKG
jgi:hypothetical protein